MKSGFFVFGFMVLGFLVGWWVCEHELVVESGGGFGPPVTIGVANGDFTVGAWVFNYGLGFFYFFIPY